MATGGGKRSLRALDWLKVVEGAPPLSARAKDSCEIPFTGYYTNRCGTPNSVRWRYSSDNRMHVPRTPWGLSKGAGNDDAANSCLGGAPDHRRGHASGGAVRRPPLPSGNHPDVRGGAAHARAGESPVGHAAGAGAAAHGRHEYPNDRCGDPAAAAGLGPDAAKQ